MATAKKRNSLHICVLYPLPVLATPILSTSSFNRSWSTGKSRPDHFQISRIRSRFVVALIELGCWIRWYTHVISAQRQLASGDPVLTVCSSRPRYEPTRKPYLVLSTYSSCSSSKPSRVHKDRSVNSDFAPRRHRRFQRSAAVKMGSAALNRLIVFPSGERGERRGCPYPRKCSWETKGGRRAGCFLHQQRSSTSVPHHTLPRALMERQAHDTDLSDA